MDSRHKPIANRLNSEAYHKKNAELQGLLTHGETDSWIQHPCTQILLNTLSADYADLVVLLIGGAYSNEDSVDATAQKTAKARGQAQAIEDLLEHIYDIRDLNFDQEEQDDFTES